MDEQKSQNTHYVPEWLLWKFRKPYLFELVIFTGKTEQRNPKKAASGIDLWSEDIEKGLSEHDNNAAQIYRKKLASRDQILLTADEKRQFSNWLSQFYVRAPKRLVNAKKFLEENSGKLDDYIRQAVYNNRDKYLIDFRTKHSETYNAAVAEIGGELVDAHILETCVDLWKMSGEARLPEANVLRQRYMRNNQSETFAEILRKYRWTWVRSNYGFVIGDHPLITFHAETQHWDFGINRLGVEISMPLSEDLSLVLTQDEQPESATVEEYDALMTRRLNCRQRVAATKNVFGSSPELLDFISVAVVL